MNNSGGQWAYVAHDVLVLGAGAVNGTINVGGGGVSDITAPLESAATTVPGGNVINVFNQSSLVVNAFGSNTNAVLTKTGLGTVYVEGSQAHGVGSQVIVSQGTFDIDTDCGTAGANLALNASGGVTNMVSNQYLSTLTVGSGAKVAITPVAFPNPRLVVVTTLFMNGGTLDVGDNDVICQNGNLTSIRLSLLGGYSGGTWTGVNGINSSNAAADTAHLHAVGAIQNKSPTNQPLYPTLDGQNSVTTDVLVRYTYYGDTNLDGKVDGSDYSRVDAAYLADRVNPTAMTGWYNGDFNYDGTVDGSDYTLMDNAFNTQGAQLAASIDNPGAQATDLVAAGAAAVPEPSSLLLLAVGAGALGRRRRPA